MTAKPPIKEHIAEYSFARARDSLRSDVSPRRTVHPDVSRYTRPPIQRDTVDDDKVIYSARLPNSTRRYQATPQGPSYVVVHDQRSWCSSHVQTQSSVQQVATQLTAKQKAHPLVFVGVGMLLMFGLWLAIWS